MSCTSITRRWNARRVEIFVGLEVDRLEDVPVRLSIKITADEVCVFTLVGQQIVADWSAEMQAWLTDPAINALSLRFSALR
jgi:hypothetical protein